MKPLAFNMRTAKKISGDKHSSTFQLAEGHQIKVAHAPLSALHRKQLEQMPAQKFEDGGPVNSSSINDTADSALPVTSQPDASIAQDIGSGIRTAAGWASNLGPIGLIKGAVAAANSQPAKDFANGLLGTDAQADTPKDSASQSPALPSPSSASSPTSGLAPSSTDSTPDLSGAYQQGLKGIQEQKDVASKLSAAEAKAYEDQASQRQKLESDAQESLKNYKTHSDQFMNDYANNHIDRNAVFKNMGTGQKIATAIGLLLGGIGSGFTGRNQAQEYLNKQIDESIDAQKNEQEKSKNLLNANRQLYGDEQVAQNQTRINMNDAVAHEIKLQGAKLGTPAAQAAADQAAAQYKMANIPLLQQSAARTAVIKNLQSGGGGKGLTAMDLSKAGMIKPEDAEKEQGFVNSAHARVNQANNIFDKLEKEQTAGNAFNPQSYARVHQLAAQLVPLVQDEDPSKRLTEQSYQAEIEPFLFKTMATGETRHEGRQGVLNLIKTAMTGKAPHMEQYAPGSLPNYSVPQASSLEGKTASNAKGQRVIMKQGQWVPYGG